MRSIWCLLLIFTLSNCFAWETSATSEALSALIDKLIAQTDTKPIQENIKYRESENNARTKLMNDSNVIYLKLVPNKTYNMTLQPNSTIYANNFKTVNKSKESEKEVDQEKSLIERNIQRILNSTNNKNVLKKILHEIKNKIDKNKPEQEKEHKLRTPVIVNSNENNDPSAYEKYMSNGFVDLSSIESRPKLVLSKKTMAFNNDANIEKTVPDVLTSIKNQIPSINENDIKELLNKKLEIKQTKDENLSPIEHIPSRRRYSSNEVTAINTRSNLLRNPSLLGSLDISANTIPNYNPLNLCGNCKHLGFFNPPLNNIINNNAMLQQVMRRNLIGSFINTIRPKTLYKNYNGINFK